MLLPVEIKTLLFCIVIITPSCVKGLCESIFENNVCSSCASVTLSQECCTDENAYAICNYCFRDPESCANIDNILLDLDRDNDIFERHIRSGKTSNDDDEEDLPYYYPPQRRAKYFLGKRSDIPSGKRLKNNFLGKRDSLFNDELDERALPFLAKRGGLRPFLGKRGGLRPFLGKRSGLRPFLGKRGGLRPFLGKRGGLRPFLGKRYDIDEEYEDTKEKILGKRDTSAIDNELNHSSEKRARPFLGKRNNADVPEKKMRPFLGKRDQYQEKRARPFLGKRDEEDITDSDDTEKRARPFLGKRNDDEGSGRIDESVFSKKRSGLRPFLGKRGDNENNILEKRARPFLGKRQDRYDLLKEIEKRARPFLGKRNSFEKRETRSNQKSYYMQPFTRRAKYFLGKRDGPNKRPKYFLGKRTVDLSGIENQRPKYFLGERSTS